MSHLDAIRSLQEALTDLATAREKLSGVPDWMQELHAEYSGRKSEIEVEEAASEEAERVRREAEGKHSDAQEKLKQYQQQIGQVSTQREYGALLKEIDTVKEQIKEAEEKAMAAIEANEEAKNKAQQLRDDFQELEGRYKVELAKWEAEKPDVQSRAKTLEATIEEARGQLPRPILSLFDRIFERTQGDAMAEAVRMATRKGETMWHCSACSFNVRPQTFVLVQRGEIHHCDSCKRILFWQPEAEEE